MKTFIILTIFFGLIVFGSSQAYAVRVVNFEKCSALHGIGVFVGGASSCPSSGGKCACPDGTTVPVSWYFVSASNPKNPNEGTCWPQYSCQALIR
ncbi:MAG: hypothetical protein WCH62_07880 [Candidatus Omnitrophota bacterium]